MSALKSESRRLRHSSRSAAAVTALVVTALAAAYVGTESVLALLDRPPLLIAPEDAVELVRVEQPWSLVTAIVLALVGLVLLVLAFAPGRRSLRELDDERALVLVDDDVLASYLSRSAASEANVDPRQVRTVVARRHAAVRVTPSSGFPVDMERVRERADAAVTAIAPRRAVRITAAASASGELVR